MLVSVIDDGVPEQTIAAGISEFMRRSGTDLKKEYQLKIFISEVTDQRFKNLIYGQEVNFRLNNQGSQEFYYLGKDGEGFIFQSYC